ncbi:MAG: hypothetical protein M1429_02650 [Patescibacteria group bacterium]|nr:hypothetical protein [Patescibacteria group bacterium]
MKVYTRLAKSAAFGGVVTAITMYCLVRFGLNLIWAGHIAFLIGAIVSYFGYRFDEVLLAIPSAVHEGAPGFLEAMIKIAHNSVVWTIDQLKNPRYSLIPYVAWMISSAFLTWFFVLLLLSHSNHRSNVFCILFEALYIGCVCCTLSAMIAAIIYTVARSSFRYACQEREEILKKWISYFGAPYGKWSIDLYNWKRINMIADHAELATTVYTWPKLLALYLDAARGAGFWIRDECNWAAYKISRIDRVQAKIKAVAKALFWRIHTTERMVVAIYGPLGGIIGFLVVYYNWRLSPLFLLDVLVISALVSAGLACAAYRLISVVAIRRQVY